MLAAFMAELDAYYWSVLGDALHRAGCRKAEVCELPRPRIWCSFRATTRDPRSLRPSGRHSINGRRSGWSSTAARTDPAERLQQMAASEPGLRVLVLTGKPGQGGGDIARHSGGAALGLHPRPDHGFRRSAPGRRDPGVHAGLGNGARRHGARAAGVRFQRAESARQRPPNLQLVGQSGDALGGHRRFSVRLSRLSDGGARARDAPSTLDAPVRFRRRSGGPPELAGSTLHQSAGAGAVLSFRRTAACRTSATDATMRC